MKQFSAVQSGLRVYQEWSESLTYMNNTDRHCFSTEYISKFQKSITSANQIWHIMYL